MLSGADLKCRDGRSLDDHVSDLVAPQKELNQKNARAYFASLSKTREGARRMADKALENQLAGAATAIERSSRSMCDAERRTSRQYS